MSTLASRANATRPRSTAADRPEWQQAVQRKNLGARSHDHDNADESYDHGHPAPQPDFVFQNRDRQQGNQDRADIGERGRSGQFHARDRQVEAELRGGDE